MKTKPSDFKNYPSDSVTRNSECETVAQNIMIILSRTGDKFRPFDFEEYQIERKKDGNFSQAEKTYFEKVRSYCADEDTAKTFSKEWR